MNNESEDGEHDPDEYVATRDQLERALQSILRQLRDYLDDVVIVGGWVPHLYQRYGGFPAWHGRLSLTSEADILLNQRLGTTDRLPLSAILASAGFAPTVEHARAAVWTKDPALGEKIEFLVPNAGTLRGHEGQVIAIQWQPRIGAVALSALDILERHTQPLQIATGAVGEAAAALTIRVPTLGAYVINKAATFNKRTSLAQDGRNLKRAKDLLYLRDIAVGGPAVFARVEQDIATMVECDTGAQQLIDTAANHVELVYRSAPRALGEVAEMLAERDGITHAAAAADVSGHLLDLADVLSQFRSAPAPGETSSDSAE